jgi:hypothetical protein
VLVTFSEFAAIKGCSKAAITAAIRTERIAAAVVEKDGKRWLDRDVALELWNKNTKKTHNARVSEADPVESQTPRELQRRVAALPDDEIPELNESRARREHYQAELAKLEVDLKRRELVPAVEVKKEAFALGRSVARGAGEFGGPTEPSTSW